MADDPRSGSPAIPAGGARVTLPSDTEILIVRHFAAPPPRVFDAWTHTADVARWWDPRGLPLAICEIDLRPGGTFRFVPQPPNDVHPVIGLYREIVRPERLVFTTPGPTAGTEAVATLLFEKHHRGTTLSIRMTCVNRAHRDALLRARIDAGTVATLECLDAHLNRAGRP